jgi:hypothetical protein
MRYIVGMEIAMTATKTDTKTHVFERAGLGLAPYKFIGYSREIFQAVPGDPNCPIQPGSSCDYCGQGIMDVFRLRSRDGRTFKVGCDCINKAGDKGLKREIAPAVREQQHKRDDARIAAAKALLTDDVKAALSAQPHPYKFMADRGATLLDMVTWNMDHAGRAGKIKASRIIERATEAR